MSYILNAPGGIDYTMDERTTSLRWSAAGVLQQAWSVIHYKGGVPHKQTIDWRDVPVEVQPS